MYTQNKRFGNIDVCTVSYINISQVAYENIH